jgi:hypothetical protein
MIKWKDEYSIGVNRIDSVYNRFNGNQGTCFLCCFFKKRRARILKKQKNLYNAALYCRLSRDDENSSESENILNQKQILSDFAKENKFNIVDYYADDGYSGTNFDRPAFKRMIKDVENGTVNVAITKDLSRLGRNYILTGQYTD